jgi:hypothetical protein
MLGGRELNTYRQSYLDCGHNRVRSLALIPWGIGCDHKAPPMAPDIDSGLREEIEPLMHHMHRQQLQQQLHQHQVQPHSNKCLRTSVKDIRCAKAAHSCSDHVWARTLKAWLAALLAATAEDMYFEVVEIERCTGQSSFALADQGCSQRHMRHYRIHVRLQRNQKVFLNAPSLVGQE